MSGSSTQAQSDAIQVAALPTASAQYVGKVYQYIGNDTETEKHGLFYGCIEENSEYKWVQVNTDPDTEIISNEKLAAMWETDMSVVDVQALNAMSNGTYNAPNGVAYNPVVVDVQEDAWEPLEDGYSNFWVNIPPDRKTLALNLYSKSESAVIDWGDGSGEVALDTLIPTHTYSDTGKYIIKLKGVTGIGQLSSIAGGIFTDVFEYIELNNEVITVVSYAFRYVVSLKDISCRTSLIFGTGTFQYCGLLSTFTVNYASIAANQFNQCFSLRHITLSRNVTSIGVTAFGLCTSLATISIPDTVTTIDNYAFRYCTSLSEIHIAATVPPTLGTDVFSGIASTYTIYVPAGYGETYKAAAGWSTYADHIVEES